MIEIKHLSLKLGDFDLKDVSLAINNGEYFVILGPTGAGGESFMLSSTHWLATLTSRLDTRSLRRTVVSAAGRSRNLNRSNPTVHRMAAPGANPQAYGRRRRARPARLA
jgi:energy-coupling factor transporter ATP-binding protein EcfA2